MFMRLYRDFSLRHNAHCRGHTPNLLQTGFPQNRRNHSVMHSATHT
jgi:hypothetical protein